MLVRELFEMADRSFSTVMMVFKSNFSRRGIRILFPTHSQERATEGDRGSDVQERHVMDALTKILRLYDNNDPQFMGVLEAVKRTDREIQVVFKYPYDNTVLNIPSAFELDRVRRGGFRFAIKTFMVKPNFKPHSTHDIVIVLN